jgi:hypothetical protein
MINFGHTQIRHSSNTISRFEFHLHPRGLQLDDPRIRDTASPPELILLPGKTVIEFTSDFLAYLFDCAKEYIVETYPSAGSLLAFVDQRIDVVLNYYRGRKAHDKGRYMQLLSTPA